MTEFLNLNFKEFKKIRVSSYIKNKKFFFINQTTNTNSESSKKSKYQLQKLQMKRFKITKSTASVILKDSIYKNYLMIFQNLTAFLKPLSTKIKIKKSFFENLEKLLVFVLIMKLNNKVYTAANFKNLIFFSYNCNKLLVYCLLTLFNKQLNLNFKSF